MANTNILNKNKTRNFFCIFLNFFLIFFLNFLNFLEIFAIFGNFFLCLQNLPESWLSLEKYLQKNLESY